MKRQINGRETVYIRGEPPRASSAWVLVGLLLGIIGLLIALATDNGDGRVSKTLGGCLLGFLLIALAVTVIVGLAVIGPEIGNSFDSIIERLNSAS